MSGYCSVRFLANLLKIVGKNPEGLAIEDLKRKMDETCFDARAFSLPNDAEVVHCINWRIKDVMRNSKNNLGFAHFHHDELVRMNPKQVQIKLKTEKGVDWHDMPEPYKYGCFVKRDRFKEQIEDAQGRSRNTTKTRWVSKSMNLGKNLEMPDNNNLKYLGVLMMEKFLNSTPPDMQKDWTPVEYNVYEPREREKEKESKD